VKSYHKLLLLLLLALAAAALASPWVAAAFDLAIERNPAWAEYRQPFGRIFNRTFMVAGVLLFIWFRGWLRIRSWEQLGLKSREPARELALGFALAVSSFAAVVAAMAVAGIFTPFLRLPLSVTLGRLADALLAGVTVGFLEEIFFRGLLFKPVFEDRRPLAAYLGVNLFYAAVHFFEPPPGADEEPSGPWSGFGHLIATFAPFLDPLALLPGLFGLFLLGVVLSYAWVCSGSLYLAIGLHAGWVFGLKSFRLFGDYSREDLGFLFGSGEPKILSGLVTWAGLLLVALVLRALTHDRRAQGDRAHDS
jgi:membrane protease YdiL (CAAX protease family)